MDDKKHVIFPLIMTIVSMLLFIPIYLFLTVHVINPLYMAGLIFAVPSISFGAITVFAFKNKLRVIATLVTTSILIPVFAVGMCFAGFFVVFDAVTRGTTDVAKYEIILETTSEYNGILTKSFPKQIPPNASNVKLYYSPAFLQGGEEFVLLFTTDSESIANYKAEFSKQAEEFSNSLTTPPDYSCEDVQDASFYSLGFNYDPPGFVGYLLYSTINDPWHGDYSFVAINSSTNTIIFALHDG